MNATLIKLYFVYRGTADRILAPMKKRAVAKVLTEFSRPYKLHLGCGGNRFEGWVNIDADADLSGGTADIIWDLTKGIPLEDSSCSLIYSEHMLEHMKVEQGLNLLRECHRVLKPGGVVRVAMPSLDDLIKKSYEGNWRDQDWLSWPYYQTVQTRAEMLNISFRSWGHQWLYDGEELHRRIIEAGFANFKDVGWGQSETTELCNLETRVDSRLICEAIR
jgi:predicted SAM-dependent methyltransferase